MITKAAIKKFLEERGENACDVFSGLEDRDGDAQDFVHAMLGVLCVPAEVHTKALALLDELAEDELAEDDNSSSFSRVVLVDSEDELAEDDNS